MHDLLYVLILYINLVLFAWLYFYVRRHRKVVAVHLGMNIAMAMGGLVALSAGIFLIFQYPFHFTAITMAAALAGMVAGTFFGALFDYQTVLTGLINGMMMGLMAPMLGAIVTEPYFFTVILEVFIALIISVLFTAVKRS
ncbi:hypothetical protein C772_01557 [Bhargavaea cecembensis DSE10]|uniref:Uncharacterized protein n=1 Tax=Bhargavaea cecembensis DSE10 TaxID=1235279 RepID=M7NGJ8_9BACL|nr:hypothetical protein [Bhargavaea cecembensis]EMR06286.1 hypothetical protein C772_01557 [Bhargavaea cecembensis DSE10]